MQVSAVYRNAKGSAQKARLVVDQIRGLRVDQALKLLDFSKKRAAAVVKKALNSAIANAEHNEGADIDQLWISKICVDGASMLKRVSPRARGRADRILKRTCHISVQVSDSQ